MTDSSVNNKRIAKNTLFLYFRMMLTILVSFYTVRVVLKILGVEDYGIYNVVGGVVSMFSLLSGTMASASQRFFAFELGKKNYARLKQTFSLTLVIFVGIAIIIFLLAETLGLWFLNTQMNIPPERMNAAHWVYQFSIFSFMLTMFTIPYNASIIAHERMSIYAWVSILEVVLKLLAVYLLELFSFDKLKLYSVLVFSVTIIVTTIYRTYCKRKFEECSFSFYWDKQLFKNLTNYSLWSLFGNSVNIFRNQGVSILMNLFFNPIVNAAQALAMQINIALMNFSNNFYTAVKPQITKNYSNNNIGELSRLIYSSARYAFYLMFILSIPLIFETNYILSLWLVEIPQYTVIFTKIIIVNTLIEVINMPIVAAIQATGRLKWYQLTTSVIQLLILPITYICYRIDLQPHWAYYIMILLSLLSNIPRLIIYQKETSIAAKEYLRKVVSVIVIVAILSIIPILILNYYLDEGFLRIMLILLYDLLIIPVIIYFVGIEQKERLFIKLQIKQKIQLKR